MARTQILVQRWGGGGGELEQGFWHCFTYGLNQSLISSVAQAIPNGELTCSLINFLLPSLFQMLAYSFGDEFLGAIQVLNRKETFLSFDFT